MKIIFFGTPLFAADILAYLVEQNVEIAAVVTKVDKPKGRSGTPQPSPVKVTAQALLPSVPVYQPEKASAPGFAPTLEAHRADLFVVVGYGEIIKQHLLDMPRLACINVHGSLLPKYRGAAPIQRCLIDGEKESGITIMHMVRKLDAGDIIRKQTVAIDDQMNAGELFAKLCQTAKTCLLEVIHAFAAGPVAGTPQKEEEATYAHKIALEECEIHWDQPARQIHNLIRGVTPHPGAWCWATVHGQKKRLKILRTRLQQNASGAPGTVLSYDKEGIVVACREGAVEILALQLEGKKALSAERFVVGTPQLDFACE